MGLRETIAAAVKAGMVATGNLRAQNADKSKISYLLDLGGETYNVETGNVTPNERPVPLTNAFLTSFSRRDLETNPKLLPTDQKLIVFASELSREPKTTDRVLVDSLYWTVKDWTKDPVSATYTVQLRLA